MASPQPAIREPKRSTHVALLRGVNVGGKNKIAMGMLAGEFEKAGASAVRTYIQSGNVLFSPGPRRTPARIADAVGVAIERQLGFKPVIVVRTAAETCRVSTAHPLAAKARGGKGLYVGFLDRRPTAASVMRLDPDRSPGDEFEVRGAEIFLLYSAAKTRLTNTYIDNTLGVTSTMRNWRTVCMLAEMLALS